MIIQQNNVRLEEGLYENRSRRYLLPATLLIKTMLGKDLNLVCCGCGISNIIGLTLLFDVTRTNVESLIERLKRNGEYKADFIVSDIFHAVVLNLPFLDYEKFLEGKYSELYTKDQLETMKIRANGDLIMFPVVYKQESALDELVEYLFDEYATGPSDKKYKTQWKEVYSKLEYDIPPKLINEFFNYDSSRISITS